MSAGVCSHYLLFLSRCVHRSCGDWTQPYVKGCAQIMAGGGDSGFRSALMTGCARRCPACKAIGGKPGLPTKPFWYEGRVGSTSRSVTKGGSVCVNAYPIVRKSCDNSIMGGIEWVAAEISASRLAGALACGAMCAVVRVGHSTWLHLCVCEPSSVLLAHVCGNSEYEMSSEDLCRKCESGTCGSQGVSGARTEYTVPASFLAPRIPSGEHIGVLVYCVSYGPPSYQLARRRAMLINPVYRMVDTISASYSEAMGKTGEQTEDKPT
jgi:hypothetical protein